MTQPFLHVARVLLRKRRPVNSVTSTEEEEAYDSRFGWKEVSGCTRDAVLRLARAWCYHTLALQLVAIKSDCRRCRRAFFYRQQRQLQITGLFFSVVSSLGIRREKRSKAIRYKTLCVSFKNRRQFIYVEVVLLLPTHFACFFLFSPLYENLAIWHIFSVYLCTSALLVLVESSMRIDIPTCACVSETLEVNHPGRIGVAGSQAMKGVVFFYIYLRRRPYPSSF